MRAIWVVIIVLTLGLGVQGQETPYRVVGYYTSWSIYARNYFVTDIPADQLTHINYAFANVSAEHECILGDAWADTEYAYPSDADNTGLRGNFNQLNLLKAAHPQLKTMISVGGWTWSARFSDVALTAESRAAFARSCVAFMVEYGFDGIDIDWEYPAGGGHPLNIERPEDPENFVLLLEAVRAELDAQEARDGRDYLLTIAVGAGRSTYEPVDWTRVHPPLDFINVMAYDMAGGWSDVTGHQAPLYDSTANPPEGTSADTAMRDYLALGVPADKLVLGVPFYGRGWTGARMANDGLHQPFAEVPAGTWEPGSFDYEDLVVNYLPSFTRIWDATAAAPLLFDAASGTVISYDDAESMTVKAGYVRDNGFGGVMFWELSGDDSEHTLLRTLFSALNTAN